MTIRLCQEIEYLMSNLSCLPPQKPQAATSNRAPSVAIAVAPFKTSPYSGCKCGSTQMSWQTSVITVAVKSRTSLWCKEGKNSLGQDSTCCMEKDSPQAQWASTFSGDQPYLSARASQKAPLCSEKPSSSIGRGVSQLEAPFAWAKSIACCRGAGTRSRTSDAVSLSKAFLLAFTLAPADTWAARQS